MRQKLPKMENVYEAVATAECPKGVRGRIAAVEMLEMNKELENAILHNAPETELTKIARKQGMLTMKEDAMIKALNRIIPFEEVGGL